MNEAEGNPQGLKTDKTERKQRTGKYWEHNQAINHKHNNTITKIKNVKHKESKEIQTQKQLKFLTSWLKLDLTEATAADII